MIVLMGKKGRSSSSWLSAVKRVFRSSTKETDKKKGEQHGQEDDEKNKKDKKGWIIGKPTNRLESTVTPKTQTKLEEVSNGGSGSSAQVTVELTQLTMPSNHDMEHYAAIIIQTEFRRYLARRALRALRGVVKLQALVRGQNVRKQAKMTLRRMQALVRAQSRVLDQRVRLSHEGNRTYSSRESPYVHGVLERKSMSGERTRIADHDWDEQIRTIRKDKIKTMEVESSQPNNPKTINQIQYLFDQHKSQRPSSPVLHRTQCGFPHHHSFITPSPSKSRPTQVRSASPRYHREDRSLHASQTPRTNHLNHWNIVHQHGSNSCSVNSYVYSLPNYMAATESAKARIRTQSAPRQRQSTPEREQVGVSTAKKRLAFRVPESYVRSPSFKSVTSHLGIEQQSSYSSCYAESIDNEGVSPSSITQLRSWLR